MPLFQDQEFENALNHYKRSNDIFTDLEDKEGQLRALKKLHKTAFNLKQYDEAINYCLQIQHLAESIDDKSNLAYAYSRLGRIKGEIMNDLKSSREYSFQSCGSLFRNR